MVNESENFEFLYAECFVPVYKYLFFRVRNRDVAMDLAQDVFVQSLRSGSPIVRETALRYFYTAARNRLADHFRKKRTVEIDSFDDYAARIPDPNGDPEQGTVRADDLSLARSLLAKIPDRDRDIVEMRHIQELSYAEISAITGKTEESVRQVLSRSIRKMRTYYEQQ